MIWFLCGWILSGNVACGPVATTNVTASSAPSGVSRVQLFVEPDAGVGPVLEFIDQSRQTLDVAMYLLSDRDVNRALEEAKRRGVRVRVMLEEHPYGSGPGNASIAQSLRNAGVATAWAPANFQLSHDKYAIADRTTALVGTANWTHAAFTANREYLVVDTNPEDVQALENLFQADWQRQQGDLTDPHLVVSPVNSRSDLVALIDSARGGVDLEAEELQDAGIEDALIRAARRGVTVRVVTVAGPANDANADGRQHLAAGGVGVRTLQSPYIHAKDLVADRREAFVGSENISTASLDRNREVGLLVDDAGAITILEDTFSRDWQSAR
ncbi:MAG TPA: phospholipase D-like domain-containing protein [Chloroflexota bacterium]|nr:phospholipase D-like domain-containing protein [Chloroflexota bacterium]